MGLFYRHQILLGHFALVYKIWNPFATHAINYIDMKLTWNTEKCFIHFTWTLYSEIRF